MAVDYKSQAVEQLMLNSIDILTPDQQQKMHDVIYRTLYDYDVDIKQEVKDLPMAIDDFNNEIIKKFLISKTIRGLSHSTLKQYKLRIQNLLYKLDKRVDKITTDDIRYYMAMYKYTNNISSNTLESMRLYFSSFFGWLYKEELIKTNPMNRMESIKIEYHKENPFSASELEALSDNCEDIRDRAIMEFLLSTGCRVSEMCSINVDDVDYFNKKLTVIGKGNKQRIVYLSEKAIYYLKKYILSREDNNEALFISKRGCKRVTKSSVEIMFRKLGDKAGVANTHPHRFRRTFCCTLIDRGMALQDVKELMGHSKVDTTLIYYNNSSKKIKNEYDTLI